MQLAPADRALAESQRFCPVETENRLGSMGPPVKIMIDGQPVFLCCEGCEESAMENKHATLEKIRQLRSGRPSSTAATTSVSVVEQKIAAALAKLPPDDRAPAETQRFCAVLEKSRLGSMGVPVKVMIDGKPVFLCCANCRGMALKNPQATLAKARKLAGVGHD